MAQGPDILQKNQYKLKDGKQTFEYGVKKKTLFRLLAQAKIGLKISCHKKKFSL